MLQTRFFSENPNQCPAAGPQTLTGPMDEVELMRAIFSERRDRVVDGLNGLPGFTCRVPGGAFYAFPNVKGTGLSSRELARRLLQEAHVALIPGDSFGENGRGYLRLSYAAGIKEIDEALSRMHRFLEREAA